MAHRDLIAVDIGNSFAKLQAIDVGGPPWESGDVLRISTAALKVGSWQSGVLSDWLERMQIAEPARWSVGTVHGDAERALREWVARMRPSDSYRRLSREDLPLEADVEYPERVGIDRLLNALAASRLRTAGRPAVIIDAGSAVTVDALSADNRFLGGAILPGLRMAAAALSDATDQLPLVRMDAADWPAVIGRSTMQAIHSGVLWGMLGAVREVSRRVADQLGQDTLLFVTGGDASCLSELMSERVEFHPHLVLAGIRLLETRVPAELSR